MRKLRRILSILLVVTMIFTNQGMVSFAKNNSINDVIENVTNQVSEEKEIEYVEEISEEQDVIEEKQEEIDKKEDIQEELEKDQEEKEEIKDIEEDIILSDNQEEDEEVEGYEEEKESDDVNENVEKDIEEDVIQDDNISTDSEIDVDDIEDLEINQDELELDVASPSEMGIAMLGVAPSVFYRTIIFDCGKGPGLEYTNFESFVGSKITKISGTNKYKIDIASGNRLDEYLGIVDPSMLDDFGSGPHVKMPVFDTTWFGYMNPKWVYDNGEVATTLEYATAYNEGETVYTASWEKDPSVKVTATVSYLRQGAASGDREMLPKYIKEEVSPGTIVTLSEKEIPGYSIVDKKQEYIDDDGNIKTGNEVFQDKNFDGSYSDTDPALGFNAEGQLYGALPNHDINIEIYYAPDLARAKKLKVEYKDASTLTALQGASTESIKPEEVIERTPPTINGYTFSHPTLTGGDIESNGIYKLGTYFVDGQTADYIDPSKVGPEANGHFKAKMPNQDITLTYYYNQDPTADVTVNCIYQFETETGVLELPPKTKVVSLNTIAEFTDRSGFPDLAPYGVPVYNNNSQSGIDVSAAGCYFKATARQADSGNLAIKVTDASPKTVYVKFSYDYTSTAYWQRISFSNSDHGTVTASSGATALTDRYISIGNHNFNNDFIKNVEVAPDENYKFNHWYRGLDTGIGKANNTPLEGTNVNVTLTGSGAVVNNKYVLYAEFIKDPLKWSKIIFEKEPQSTSYGNFTSLTTEFEIGMEGGVFNWDSTTYPITFPSCAPVSAEYEFKGWRLSTEAVGTIHTEAEIKTNNIPPNAELKVYAVFGEKVLDDGKYHMPVSEMTQNVDGTAKVKLYGTHPNRKYILTDRNGAVLENKNGSDMSAGFTTSLLPGELYKTYEIKKDASYDSITNISEVDSSEMGDAYDIHVPAVKSFTVSGNATGGFTISFSKAAGVEYALLGSNGSDVEKPFTTNPNFSGLHDADKYFIIAKKAGSATTEADCRKQAVVVHTEKKNITNREYRLVINGDAYLDGGIEKESSVSGGKVYYVTAGTSIKLVANSSGKWSVDTNNVNIANDTATTFTTNMPNGDLYLTFKSGYTNTNNSSIEIINNTGGSIGVKDKFTVLEGFDNNYLNDILSEVGATTADGYAVKYYVIYDKQGIPGNGADSQYNFSIKMKLAVTVNNILVDWTGASSETVELVYLLDERMLGHKDYQNKTGTTFCEYDSIDGSVVSSAWYHLTTDDSSELSVNFTKTHTLTLKSEGINGISYSQDFDVTDGELLSSADIVDIITDDTIKNIMQDTSTTLDEEEYHDESQSTVASKYLTKVYKCKGLFDGSTLLATGRDTPITKNSTFTLKFEIDNERETNKAKLKEKIDIAQGKLDLPIGQLQINADAINNMLNGSASSIDANGAIYIMEHQPEYNVADLLTAADEVDNMIQSLQSTIDVTIDPNGGTLNTTSLQANIGQAFGALNGVTGTNGSNYLGHFNTDSGDAGTTISASTNINSTIINLVNSQGGTLTIYAIWSATPAPNPTPHGGGGGGGGSSGGGSITSTRYSLEQNQNAFGPMYKNAIGEQMLQNSGYAFANAQSFTNGTEGVLFTDKSTGLGTDLYFYKNDKTFLTNSWAIITTNIDDKFLTTNNVGIYYFGADGKAKTGLLTQGDKVYYLSKDQNNAYCQLKTGWTFDNQARKWYYSDKNDGSIKTGWQEIEGKYYYFNSATSIDANGKLDVNNMNYGNGYGQLLTNAVTPDGRYVDENGEVVK